MDRYVDGYVVPVAKDKLDAYIEMASDAGRIWMKHGALAYYECVGEDLSPDVGGMEMDNFAKRFELSENETAVFAFVIYESREHRDEVNGKVMNDPEMSPENHPKEIPFEVKRMLFGGFKTIVALDK